MLFLYNKDLKQSLDFYPAQTFPPLDHVYKKMYGEFAERTTRTENFEGALDHIFASPKAVIKQVAKMPTIKELQEAGNVTIFTPFNEAFDKLPTKIEDLPLPTQQRIVLKHFVKGFLFKKDIKNGPVSYC